MCWDNFEGSYFERRKALVSQEQLEKELFGEWVVDERTIKLDELLTEQYNLVEDMTNKQSSKSWKEFCDTWESEYSLEEIKQGRKNLQLRGVR